MAYKDNPFNSAEGIRLMEEIYDLMWVKPETGTKAIETNDLGRQVNHYRSNIISMVNKMRKFVTGYQQVPLSETKNSGIHVCPSCTRRDFIWYWDVLDAGHYSDPSNWVSSVVPSTWSSGSPNEKGRYLWMVRYKCNEVTTCKACYQTTKGKYSSCQACGSSNITNAGCGEESYAQHYIREYTFKDNHPTNDQQKYGVLSRNRQVPNKSNRKEVAQGSVVKYKFVHNSLPNGRVVSTQGDMEKYTPYVEFTYEAFGDSQKRRAYPISELNYAVSKQYVRRCRMGRNYNDGTFAHPTKPHILPQGKSRCPSCDANDYPPLEDLPGLYYPATVMRIKSPQPLGSSGQSGISVKGFPVYNIRVESTGNDDYKLLLPLPQIYTLHPVPSKPEPQIAGVGVPTCPNDVGAGVEAESIYEEAKKEIEELQDSLSDRLKTLVGLGPCDAVTAAGYSFVVCEGRSREAVYDKDLNEWIDKSPNCTGYGKTYPRWNRVPDYADPKSTFTEYLGPNPDSHMVQDFIKCSENLVSFSSAPPTYHATMQIGEKIDEEIGKAWKIYECQTCKEAVAAGGIVKYRNALGNCDVDGKSLNGFPQAVLDAEIAYENSFPKQNEQGEPVPVAWGVEANGKKLLERKTTFKIF